MTANAENGWELSITRHIAAPPEKVWDVMANRIEEWWCPKPWRAEFDKLERRPGGASILHDVRPRRRSASASRHRAGVGRRAAFCLYGRHCRRPDARRTVHDWHLVG